MSISNASREMKSILHTRAFGHPNVAAWKNRTWLESSFRKSQDPSSRKRCLYFIQSAETLKGNSVNYGSKF